MIVAFKQGHCGFEIFLLHVLFVIFHCSSNNEPTECIGDVAESHKIKKKLLCYFVEDVKVALPAIFGMTRFRLFEKIFPC